MTHNGMKAKTGDFSLQYKESESQLEQIRAGREKLKIERKPTQKISNTIGLKKI